MLNNPDLVTLVSMGYVSSVKEKLLEGWNPNVQSNNGISAVNKAAERNDLEMLKVLAAAGGKVNVKDGTGFTHLQIAEMNNSEAMIKYIKSLL